MNYETLAKEAVRAAGNLRRQHGVGVAEGLCPYDLAIKLDIKVSFLAAPSLEGMYSPQPEPASIILSSERPSGRRRYTCGHEIGHHVFNHGYRVDQLDESNSSASSPEEYLAQRFSSALLMPKIAVDAAFARRGWALNKLSPEQVYTISQEFGVGYTTLIANMQMNLNSITNHQANQLRSVPLSRIRETIIGKDSGSDVFVVDSKWNRSSVDLETNDVLLLPPDASISGSLMSQVSKNSFLALKQGVVEISFGQDARKLPLRISKHNFAGLARYRHLEEESDDE